MSPLISQTLVPLLLRLGLGGAFVLFGCNDVFSEGHEWGTNWSISGAISKPLQATMAWGQLIGGGALVLGLFTRLGAIIIGSIVVWVILATASLGLYNMAPYLAYFGTALALLLTGGGSLAMDRFLSFRRSEPD